MIQSIEQRDALGRLLKECGLKESDLLATDNGHSITPGRLDVVQHKLGISVEFEAVTSMPTYAAVKASATRKTKVEGVRASVSVRFETFASADSADCMQPGRYLEQAEARAYCRVILKASGLAALGVLLSDESQPKKETPAVAHLVPAPVEPQATPSASAEPVGELMEAPAESAPPVVAETAPVDVPAAQVLPSLPSPAAVSAHILRAELRRLITAAYTTAKIDGPKLALWLQSADSKSDEELPAAIENMQKFLDGVAILCRES